MATNDVKVEISDELIKQYVGITGSDESTAKHLLEAFGGDLESAVNMYLEGSDLSINKIKDRNNEKTEENERGSILSNDMPSTSSSSIKHEFPTRFAVFFIFKINIVHFPKIF